MRLRFGGCTVDFDARRVHRGGREVHLSPKAFRALELLIGRRPAAVSKADLLAEVWPGVFVSDASLARAISEIRDALGDSARQGTIRTVHSFGYAFAAAADVESTDAIGRRPAAACLLVSSTRTLTLCEGEQVVGRDPASAIPIDSPTVSWRHARISAAGVEAQVEDLGSKNGTHVRGTRIASPVTLQSGDEIRFGRVRFVFRVSAGPPVTETDTGTRTRVRTSESDS